MSYPAGPPTPPWPGGPPGAAPAVCVRHPDRRHRAELHPVRASRLPRVPARGVRRLPVRRLRRRGPARGAPRRDDRRRRAGRTPARHADARRAQRRGLRLDGRHLGQRLDATTGRRCSSDWALVPGAVADGEWWRVLTGGFLHFGPIHLLFNMMALWVIGRDVEPALGRGRFLAVYLVSLLGGVDRRDAAARRRTRSWRARRERCSGSWVRSPCCCAGCGSRWARSAA